MAPYLANVWKCRYFWLSLVKMDLRTRYRRSVLGIGWSLLNPIAMTVILCLVFHHIFKEEVHNYAPYLMSGLAFWQFILGVTLQGCQCFYQGESYIRQYPAPLAIYPLRTVLGVTIHFLLALSVVLVMSVAFSHTFNPVALLSLMPTIGLLFVLGWSLAVLGGFATVYFQDTQHLAEIGFQLLFYATPIIYRPQKLEGNPLALILKYNPLGVFLELIRDPLEGHMPSPVTFGIGCAIVLGVALLASVTLARLQRRLIFHL